MQTLVYLVQSVRKTLSVCNDEEKKKHTYIGSR